MKPLLFVLSLLLMVGVACSSGLQEAPAPAPAVESPATSTPELPALPTDTPAAEVSEPAAAEPSEEDGQLLGDEAIAAPDSIEPPVDLSAGVTLSGFEESALPLPEGASIVLSSSEFVMAQSDLPVAEIQAFFEEAMAELGWTKDEDASMAFGDFVNLVFTKDGSSLGIALAGEGENGQTQILISPEEAQ